MPHKHHPMSYLGQVILLPVQSVFSGQAGSPVSGIPSASPKAEVLLHHGYDHSRQSPMSLSLSPENQRLYWRQAGQKKQEDSGIPLPEDFTWVDAGIATGQEQLVLTGIAQNDNGFVAALNLAGQLIWRYPSPKDQEGDRFRFYDLVFSESKHRLFAAGARNGQGVLLVVDFSDDGWVGQAGIVAFALAHAKVRTEKLPRCVPASHCYFRFCGRCHLSQRRLTTRNPAG